jgi:anti-sigma-K factor RskA
MSTSHVDGPDGDDVTGLAALYALDALEGEDLARYEAYLAATPDARTEVDEFHRTAARMASATATPAPAAMRANVLGSLSSVRQVPPRIDIERDRRRRASSRRIAAIAAAVVLVFAAGIGGYRLGNDSASTGGGTETADGLTSILASEDATLVDFEGQDGLSARLVYSETSQGAVVVADSLPSPPQGSTYELWKIRDGAPVSAGLFTPRDGTVRTPVDAELSSGDTVAVTIEPAGGSESPTMPIVLSAQV